MSGRSISAIWARKRPSPARRGACSPAWRKVQGPLWAGAATTTSAVKDMPAGSARGAVRGSLPRRAARGGRRGVGMGEMGGVGGGGDAYHGGLGDAGGGGGVGEVLLCGTHMRALWSLLAPGQRGVHRAASASLAGEVAAALKAGDVIAVKGSLGSKMKNVVDAILAASDGEAGR